MDYRVRGIKIVVMVLAALAAGGRLKAQTPNAPIRLFVDASQAPQKILHAHMQIPVQPGPLVLYYPKWIPGEHMPDGPIINVAGFKFTADGKELPWRRDLVDMFALHVDIPQGVSSLDVGLRFSAVRAGFGIFCGRLGHRLSQRAELEPSAVLSRKVSRRAI